MRLAHGQSDRPPGDPTRHGPDESLQSRIGRTKDSAHLIARSTARLSPEQAQYQLLSSWRAITMRWIGTRAPVCHWNVDSLQIRLDQDLVHVPGELAEPVDLRGPRGDLVVSQRPDRLTERLVLFGQGERREVDGREVKAHASMVNAAPGEPSFTADPGRRSCTR
jgi:hypothetical protein